MLPAETVLVYIEKEIVAKYNRTSGLDAGKYSMFNRWDGGSVNSIDYYKCVLQEMCEFRKILSHLNKKMALPVCVFTVLNLSYTFSAIIYFIKIYNQYTCMKVIVMGLVNIVLWLLLGLYPFFQVSAPKLINQFRIQS